MQDGARVHTTEEVMAWLKAKFQGRVISRKAEVEWPPYSPDLNPLDYFFWSYAMIRVRRRKPATIEELKETVEDVARTVPSMTTELMWNLALSVYLLLSVLVCLSLFAYSNLQFCDICLCLSVTVKDDTRL